MMFQELHVHVGFLLAKPAATQTSYPCVTCNSRLFFLHRSQLISAPLDQTKPKMLLLNIMRQTVLHAKEPLAMEYTNLLKAKY